MSDTDAWLRLPPINDLLDPPDGWTPSDDERAELLCELNPDYFALED